MMRGLRPRQMLILENCKFVGVRTAVCCRKLKRSYNCVAFFDVFCQWFFVCKIVVRGSAHLIRDLLGQGNAKVGACSGDKAGLSTCRKRSL